MKKLIITVVALFTLGMTIVTTETTETTTKLFTIQEEEYIDDIPFDTEKIANVFTIQEEGYIDDIPFDTEKIVDTLNEKGKI